jgi:peptide/nickel transport system substrate-binding protein
MGILTKLRTDGMMRAGAASVLALGLACSGAAAQDTPQYGGHLTVGVALEPTSLDPATGRSGGDAYYYRQIFDNLVNADKLLTPDANSSLAESWEISTDPHAITFKLRDGVMFHDGTPFNAEAVKANIDRILDPETKATPRAALLRITSVDVIDDLTVRFNLDGAWGAGLSMLADRGGAVGSPTAMEQLMDDYGWEPAGTGPFKVAEVVPGSFVRMVRNEDYWGTDEEGNKLPYLDEVTLKVIKDETVLSAALRAGEIDLAYVPSRDVEAFQNDDKFNMSSLEGANIASMLAFNQTMPPMDNVHLRRAVLHAINPEDINKAVYFNQSIVADSGMWPVNTWVHQPNGHRPEYSLEKAKEELALGGMPNGFDVNIVTWNNATHPQSAEIIRAQLARVGINVKIDVLTVGPATEQFFQSNAYPIYLSSWSRYPEPDWIAALCYKSDGYYNAGNVERADMDELVAQGASTYDQEERREIYSKINDIVLGEAWMVPLLYGVYYAAAPKNVHGLDTVIAWDGKPDLKRVWIDGGN